MKELFSLLNMKERRAAAALGLVLGAAACLFLFISLKKHGSAGRTASEWLAAEQNYHSLSGSRNEVQKEWQGWMDARKNMETLKANSFYDGKMILRDLRLDLQKIFRDAGIFVTDINYGYSELAKGSLRKVIVDFRFSGNYLMLKRLLDTIELHPRFLHTEKIDFLNVGKEPGLYDFKISLAGYYEN